MLRGFDIIKYAISTLNIKIVTKLFDAGMVVFNEVSQLSFNPLLMFKVQENIYINKKGVWPNG